MSNDKRSAPRQDIVLDALIVDSAGAIVGEATVLDISATGARLVPKRPVQVPDKFDLLLSRNGKVRRRCKVMRRSDNEIGIGFVQKPPAR